ncbi:MAG: GTPase, partial [Pauljensenia sp.]
STLRAGRRVGGWLPLRWLARVGVDPLRRLHLGEESSQESATTPTLPTRCASDDAAFANAVRREVAARSAGRPDRWRGLLIERAVSGANDVPAAAHRELSANLRVSAAPPLAARVFGAAQLVAWLCVLIGAAWIVLVHLGRAVLIDAVVPAIGPIPVPTAVIACAVAVSLLCAGLSRAFCAWVASRRKRAVMEDIRSMCRDEVERCVIVPLRAEDNRQVSIASFVARLHLDERV